MAVYFIQEQDGEQLIKIGKANDVYARFVTIKRQTGKDLILLGAIAGDEREEAILHAIFADYRRHGEWFEPHELLLLFVGQHASIDPERVRRHTKGGGRPKKKRPTVRVDITLSLEKGKDDDLISWFDSSSEGTSRARAVIDLLRTPGGLNGVNNER